MGAIQKYLMDVAIIRPILIVQLVFYHAFAPYSGAWASIIGFPKVSVYWWLDKLSYAYMLEMFVLISGYVFGFQIRTKGVNTIQTKALFGGKFKRLMIPCIFFSLLYIILLLDIEPPCLYILYDMVNGVGHMWFLPMLFWCFVCAWLFEKLNMKHSIVFIGTLFLSLVSIITLPLQIGTSFYYLFFFYLGYFIQRNNLSMKIIESPYVAATLLIAFAILFPSFVFVAERVSLIETDNLIVKKIVVSIIIRICKFICATIGVTMMLSIVRLIINRYSIEHLPQWALNLGGLSMGVYLWQQFILKILYNYTIIPSMMGPYLLPWIGFLIALLVSLLLTILMKKCSFGRFLIGS